jgi:hypothetical protein
VFGWWLGFALKKAWKKLLWVISCKKIENRLVENYCEASFFFKISNFRLEKCRIFKISNFRFEKLPNVKFENCQFFVIPNFGLEKLLNFQKFKFQM